jgi:hypothetical protein
MKEMFITKKFRDKSLSLINAINNIIVEYQNQGYELTLRQIYYQLVARGSIPNTERSYKNIGSLVNSGRLAGMIDWDAVVDRTRHIRKNQHWNTPEQIVKAALNSYKIDMRENQPIYIEVWVEKDALISIVEGVANEHDVTCFSCRGYVSQSEMYQAAQRFIDQGHLIDRYILHLGDHDPSGMDMTRDIQDRLEMFGADVIVKRLALNWEQIELYNPPTNPAKLSDSRAEGYINLYGSYSWELDALEPKVIEVLIQDAIEELTDEDLLIDKQKDLKADQNKLKRMLKLN